MHPRVQAERLAKAQAKAAKAAKLIAKSFDLNMPEFDIRGPNEGIIRLRQMEVMADFLEIAAKRVAEAMDSEPEAKPTRAAKEKTDDHKN